MIVFVCWSHFHTNGTRSGEKHYSWCIVLRTILSYIQTRIVTFDIDLTLAYMDEAVENADRFLFDYVTKNYPELGISYQDELFV